MNAKNLRELSVEALCKERLELLKERFNLRMQKASSQLKKTHLIKINRRRAAYVEMLLGEKTVAR